MSILIDDYPYRPQPRRSHKSLAQVIASGRERYRATLNSFLKFAEDLRRIPLLPDRATPQSPHWQNDWLPPLDAISIYCMIAANRPSVYLEIGSGYSTKFARRAAQTHSPNTRIVSIDPMPRAEIDAICDDVLRSPLEDADLAVFNRLRPGDILFIDSSHRAFQNSDVTVFFTEVLPTLAPGVIYGIHDIFLPFDYGEPTLPEESAGRRLPEPRPSVAARFAAFVPRYYNEQYMLASYLLGGAGGDEIILPCAWVSSCASLIEILDPIWSNPDFEAMPQWGGAFWAKRGAGHPESALRRFFKSLGPPLRGRHK
jgi:hypothetical protein